MKKTLLALFLFSAQFAFPQAHTDSVVISASGQTKTLSLVGDSATFEELISGSPATVSIVLKGCMPGDTCTTLETNTSTAAAQNRIPVIAGVYQYFTATASWTGGSNVSVKVNAIAAVIAKDTVKTDPPSDQIVTGAHKLILSDPGSSFYVGTADPFGSYGSSAQLFVGVPESSLPASLRGLGSGSAAEISAVNSNSAALVVLSSGGSDAEDIITSGGTALQELAIGVTSDGAIAQHLSVGADGTSATGALTGISINSGTLTNGAAPGGVTGIQISDLSDLSANVTAIQIAGSPAVNLGSGITSTGPINAAGVNDGILTLTNGHALGDGYGFNCSNCDTPLTQGAVCSTGGDGAGAYARNIRGGTQCF